MLMQHKQCNSLPSLIPLIAILVHLLRGVVIYGARGSLDMRSSDLPYAQLSPPFFSLVKLIVISIYIAWEFLMSATVCFVQAKKVNFLSALVSWMNSIILLHVCWNRSIAPGWGRSTFLLFVVVRKSVTSPVVVVGWFCNNSKHSIFHFVFLKKNPKKPSKIIGMGLSSALRANAFLTPSLYHLWGRHWLGGLSLSEWYV